MGQIRLFTGCPVPQNSRSIRTLRTVGESTEEFEEDINMENETRKEGVILYTTDLSIFKKSANNRAITKDKRFYENKEDIRIKGYMIEPIICNRDMVIVSGHHRRAMMEELYNEGYYNIPTAYIINPMLNAENVQEDINKANNSKPTTLEDYISQKANLYRAGNPEYESFFLLEEEYPKYSSYIDKSTFYKFCSDNFLVRFRPEQARDGDFTFNKDNLRFCMRIVHLFDKHPQFKTQANRYKITRGLLPFIKCAITSEENYNIIVNRIAKLVSDCEGLTIKGNYNEMAKNLADWYNSRLPKHRRINVETCSFGL